MLSLIGHGMGLPLLIQLKQKAGTQRHQNGKHSHSAAGCMHTVRHNKT